MVALPEAPALTVLFKEVVIYVCIEGMYLLDTVNMLALLFLVHTFTANTISLLRILWSRM